MLNFTESQLAQLPTTEASSSQLLPFVYEKLKAIAATQIRKERQPFSITASSLVHEAFIQVSDSTSPRLWNGCQHLAAVTIGAMKRLLIDFARRRRTAKHGGNCRRQELNLDVLFHVDPQIADLQIAEALDLLSIGHPRKAALVRVIYFEGLTQQEAADRFGISRALIHKDCVFARAWLRVHLDDAVLQSAAPVS
jgi:RNA polymerase sigma factor (TIGR02999 family)